MQRIAIFAHFDNSQTIEKYVVFYLKELRKVVDFIIFVSDSDLKQNEVEKVAKYTNVNIVGHHGEYDFGSYKRGFKYALDNNLLNNYEELILVNDSCYAPIHAFENMFEKMEQKENIDFWGVTADRITHFSKKLIIQSYFLVFYKKIFLSDIYKQFMLSIKKEKNKADIVRKYEQGLTLKLEEKGYKWDVYSQYSKNHWESCIIDYKKLLIKEFSPTLKRSLILRKVPHLYSLTLLKNIICKYTKYDFSLIEEDLHYNSPTLSAKLMFQTVYKSIGRFIIRILQGV